MLNSCILKCGLDPFPNYWIYFNCLLQDILRKWCRITSNFDHLQIFNSKESSLKFVSILLDKYLDDDVLNECYSEDALISLTSAIMHLSVENLYLMPYVDRLLLKVLQLEVNNKIEKLLHDALYSNFYLQLSTKEKIYVSQKFKLVEEPLLNSLMCTLPDLTKENCVNNSQKNKEERLNQLLEFSTESACIFQLIFNFLKELLVQLQYAPVVLHFIDVILKRVSLFCESRNRDILDLYPRKLYSYIILLRIKPEHHTVQTRDYTLNILNQIYSENKDTLLILISHFSEWLEYFANYVANNAKS